MLKRILFLLACAPILAQAQQLTVRQVANAVATANPEFHGPLTFGPTFTFAPGTGVTLGEPLRLANATYAYWSDSGAVYRRIIGLNTSNAVYIGAIDAGWGGSLNLNSGTSTNFVVNGASGTPVTAASFDTNGNLTCNFGLKSANSAASGTAVAPTGTVSTTPMMMGIGLIITPKICTRAILTISGQMANNTVNDGCTVQLRYGTGTVPVNGTAVVGNQAGASQTHTSLVAGDTGGFSISLPITGLTPGTAYWVDAAIQAVGGGTATITGVTISATEF